MKRFILPVLLSLLLFGLAFFAAYRSTSAALKRTSRNSLVTTSSVQHRPSQALDLTVSAKHGAGANATAPTLSGL